MASINLAIRYSQVDSVGQQVRYARIDNIVSPVWITVPNITSSPGIVAEDIPNGQYVVELTGIYADLRVCSPSYVYSDPCPGLLSINAYITGNNLVVQYLAPSTAPKVRISVNYPNGGSFIANYVNAGTDIIIPLPTGVFGDFSISGQSVCDESTGFYSSPSSQVVVTRSSSNTSITNSVNGITLTTVNGITGFTLSSLVTVGNTVTGTHSAFYGAISVVFTGTPGVTSSATLSVNGTIIQCVAIPNTAGGTISFSAASFADTDLISVQCINGSCP